MAIPLTGIVGDLTNLIPSSNDILQNVLLGAGTSVVLAGLKSQAGIDAVDPLHIFHKDGTQTVVGTKTMPIASFNQLSPDAQKAVLAQGIVPV